MKICIVGKGASGWMAASYVSKVLDFVTEVTLIGSPEIKTIGVGESNTLMLVNFHNLIGISLSDFITQSDAAVKYGVYYKNWGGHDFLHNFKTQEAFGPANQAYFYFKCLTNKSDNTDITSIVSPDLHEFVNNNLVSLDDNFYPKSWHFDAAKYISYLENYNKNNKKLKVYNDTVVDCEFSKKENLKKIILKSGLEIESDYFIFASGSSDLLQNLLNEEYEDLSKILLTDKALVYPLKYENKISQFHPYTVAKTMKCGWRWITPTYSRIGTGYVFSSNHISEDDALREFVKDVGDETISPRVVNFQPKYNKKTFKENYCTIGMANGFLEPLDAPGITITLHCIDYIVDILSNTKIYGKNSDQVNFQREYSNYSISSFYKRWTAFILHQYKTSSSRDNKFWKDHRNVNWDYYDEIMTSIKHGDMDDVGVEYAIMMYHTMSAKNKHWCVDTNYIPPPQQTKPQSLVNHLDFIESIRKNG